MKKYWVYVHTCPNGKKYVGCTTKVKPEYRWVEGRGYRGRLFEEAIRKYGWDNITHEVFEVDNKEEMYRKEIELISFYHSNDPEYGYNSSIGGEKGALGCIMSEEARKHVSEGHKKKWTDPEYRRKQFEAHKGQIRSEETKRRIAEANKGKTRSEEAKRHLSEVQKKKWSDPEVRKKMSESLKGRTFSEKARKHMAEAAKNRPRIKISLPDGTVLEMTKQSLTRNYINKGKKFEYVS